MAYVMSRVVERRLKTSLIETIEAWLQENESEILDEGLDAGPDIADLMATAAMIPLHAILDARKDEEEEGNE